MTEYKQYTYNIKRKEYEALKKEYISNGTVSWATFNSDPLAYSGKQVLLANADFSSGTLRIQHPCMLKLTENISFNPNRPTTWLNTDGEVTSDFTAATAIDPNRTLDWFPTQSLSSNAQYFTSDVKFAYGLGFFAAIAIECESVIIDLNGYTLEQHAEHALQQRFFSLIELADQPFLPLQGPSNFGSILRTAINTFICNGKIGRSSHHGIHGNNGGNDIMIENVAFQDFEVAAIALNGFKNVYLRNITIQNNRQNIPVISTYSAARFIKLFVNAVEASENGTADLATYKQALNLSMDAAFNSIIFSNGSVPELFANFSGLTDCIAYGIVINPNGVAVNQLLENRNTFKSNETTNVYIINCNISDIASQPCEIITLAAGSPLVDTAGAVFQFFNGVANIIDDKYFYRGTVLSNVQIELAKIKQIMLANNQRVSMFGTLSIDKGIVAWKNDPALYFKRNGTSVQLYSEGDVPHQINGYDVIYGIVCNADSMYHVAKGTIGLRIDGVNDLYILDTIVSSITNNGSQGSLYAGNYIRSHGNQGAKLIGYQGAKCYAVTLSAVNNVTSDNLQIFNVTSSNASAYGLTIMNESQNCTFNNTCVNGVNASKYVDFNPGCPLLPNEMPGARGVFVSHDCMNITFKSINVQNIANNANNPYHFDYDIRTKVNMQ